VNEQLTWPLNSRIVIEQAKGVLAERVVWTWTTLSPVSASTPRDHNLRLVDVAHGVVNGTLKVEAVISRQSPRP